jgi:iron complex outermembrane recepter protein
MTRLGKFKHSVAPLALSLALISAPSFAQDAAADEGDEATNDVPIVVTGSLIKNPNLEQANPVNVTTADQIELKQSNLAEEVLREIPGVVANIGSAVNNGNGGSSYVDLRGLGSNRNVVLLDGNRIVPVDLQGRVDLNNIPLALVARVDALTGAAVTTYGADAVTGVVNFVTKKDFAGVDLSIGDQLTAKGDGNFLRADLTVGANFEDGRGNAVLSIGYQESDPIYQGDRDFSVFGIDSFTGTLGGSGTTVPSRITGTRPLLGANPDITPLPNSTGNGGTRQVNALGQAVGTFAFFNFNPFNIFQTPFKRYNIFAQANYEISDAVEIYTRGLFSKNTVSTIIAPSGSFGGAVTMNLNNPYLTSTLRNQFCAFNTAAPTATGSYTPRFSAAECAAAATATGPADPNYRTVTFNLSRRAVEVGPRISDYSTTVFDYRVGAKGAISDTIDWDLSGSYGESEKVQTIKNYTLQSRWRQSLLANNTTSCITTTGGCVPINPFGPAGSISPAGADFLSDNSTTTVRTSLSQVRGIVSGDLGFSSPAANEPIGFAVGSEYRKYRAQQAADVLAKTPGELGGAGGAAPDINGAYDVYEAYAEIIAPLVEDKPFFNSLTVEAGARYSKYSVKGGGTNSTTTYKIATSWEPVEDLKIRGNYNRAVRAPNIGELFTPFTVGLTTLQTDPCAGTLAANAGLALGQNLRAVCLAQGAPVGSIGAILNPTAAQANAFSGGNINLKPETATTWTIGAVLQPSFAPGFSLSVDYYNIKIKDAITTPTSGDLINDCFTGLSATSATNTACTIIRRNPVTGGLDGDPATTQGLFQPLSNLGRLSSKGVDVIAAYSRDLGFAELASNFVFNYTQSSKFQATPTSYNRECVGYFSANCSFTGSMQPKFQWSWRNTLTVDKIDISLLWRHIDKMTFEGQASNFLARGFTAANNTLYSGTLPAAFGSFAGQAVNFNNIKAADYFDLTLRFNVSDNISFTTTVQNLLDKQPPIIGSSAGTTAFNSGNTYPSTYDALGRRFAAAVRVKF